MLSRDADSIPHEDAAVRALLAECPCLQKHVDLSEHAHYIMNQVALLLRDAQLPESDANCIFKHLNRMAERDIDTQNLLVISVLEVLGDSPQSIQRTREGLGNGPARFLFERVLKGWVSDPR